MSSALFSRSKIIFSVLAVFILLFSVFLLTRTVHAQSTTTYPPTQGETINTQDQHFRAQTVLYDAISALSCLLSGIDPINPKGCAIYNAQTQTYGYATQSNNNQQVGGLLSLATNSMGQLYDIPVHTTDYVQYLSRDFGVTPNAYAAGNEGFNQLQGVLGVWTIFRNIAYLFFVIVFVVIGMGVMLRVKIDPRTVMSIQNQIPKLIVGLILITFSYAIAGFFVDLMWTSTYLVINIAGQVELPDKPGFSIFGLSADPASRRIDQKQATNSLLSSPFGFANSILGRDEGVGLVGYSGSITGTFGESVASLLTPLAGSADEQCVITHPWDWITSKDKNSLTFASCVRGTLYGALDWIARFLGFFIVLFAVLLALGRIWWALIKSFAYIVIYTTIAPFYIIAGLFPGSQTNFTSWLRGLVANLAVYPATVAMFLAMYIFQSTFDKTNFAPPLTGNPSTQGGFGYIVSFAILMVTPELIWMLRDALKAPASKYIAPSITKGVGAGAALPGAIIRGSWGRAWKFDPSGRGIGALNATLASRADTWRGTTGHGFRAGARRNVGRMLGFIAGGAPGGSGGH